MQKLEKFESLDTLRGIAAIIVILFHISWTFPGSNSLFIANSYLMVDFFFVLSGFVISHSTRQRLVNYLDIKNFVIRRFWRLYPLHIFFLFVFLAFEIVKLGLQTKYHFEIPAFSINNQYSFLSNILMFHSIGQADLSWNTPSWSIAAEFYTYIFFALIAWKVGYRKYLTILSLIIFIAAISILISLKELPSLRETYRLGLFRCFAGFFIGVLSYRVREFILTLNDGSKKHFANLALPACIGLIIALLYKQLGLSDFFMLPLFALIVTSISFLKDGMLYDLLHLPTLTFIGRISYSIYMSHLAVLRIFKYFIRAVLKLPTQKLSDKTIFLASPGVGLILLIAAIIATLAVSSLSYKFIENRYRVKPS